ncbi:hypothetical protein CORC01_08183 [Colletotrichum orchidophilum]|uniref:Uncharacterized protein n=1 Tax=Colletotrichum orchidophilum TaxID=1209926 RepID=A0A1G4B5M3_9PEZI|nr:uncharacterized protein CORC01_08183 [Colletotrichum orchidophilum]OHE96585.1 hypothetical protein CORC01_08183 [Colletotrichum orchidophilum]
MDGLLRTLTRSRNAAPSPNRGSRNRNRRGESRKGSGGNNHGQIEIILEALARGLVEYAVQKYMKKLSGGDEDKAGGGRRNHDDRRLSTRGNNHGRAEDEHARGGVPNMDMEMLEHLGKNILSKAMERFGGGSGEDEEDDGRADVRASGRSRRHGKGRTESRDRDTHSRERSQNRPHRRGRDDGKDEDRDRRRRHSRDNGYPSHRPSSQHRGCSPSPSRHRRGDDNTHRRRRYGTDYAPLKEELETLSNTIISLNERQPGHADCEFYDAFMERSGKVQEAIGSVLVQIREREDRREERRGRRRG